MVSAGRLDCGSGAVREPGYYEYTLRRYEGPAMRDNTHMSFRVSKELRKKVEVLISEGIFPDESEACRQALRDLVLKFEVMAKKGQPSS